VFGVCQIRTAPNQDRLNTEGCKRIAGKHVRGGWSAIEDGRYVTALGIHLRLIPGIYLIAGWGVAFIGSTCSWRVAEVRLRFCVVGEVPGVLTTTWRDSSARGICDYGLRCEFCEE